MRPHTVSCCWTLLTSVKRSALRYFKPSREEVKSLSWWSHFPLGSHILVSFPFLMCTVALISKGANQTECNNVNSIVIRLMINITTFKIETICETSDQISKRIESKIWEIIISTTECITDKAEMACYKIQFTRSIRPEVKDLIEQNRFWSIRFGLLSMINYFVTVRHQWTMQ